jgi:hypothetical protein
MLMRQKNLGLVLAVSASVKIRARARGGHPPDARGLFQDTIRKAPSRCSRSTSPRLPEIHAHAGGGRPTTRSRPRRLRRIAELIPGAELVEYEAWSHAHVRAHGRDRR